MPYRYKCSKCDRWHVGFPDIGYDSPFYVGGIPESERADRLFLTSDLCVIDNENFFIRCLLVLPVKGLEERFGWGVWSSLSETNFMRYQEHYSTDKSLWEPMFGYLSNQLPDYPDTLNLKLSVQPGGARMRPLLTLEPTDHPLSVQQRDGFSIDEVLRIVEPYLQE